MKRFNRNDRLKSRRGPGNQLPIKHNQKKPFNPEKYGKLWSGIDFRLTESEVVVPPATQTTIGKLLIGGQKFDITFTEANKIIETLADAKHRFNVASRMGMIGKKVGTHYQE